MNQNSYLYTRKWFDMNDWYLHAVLLILTAGLGFGLGAIVFGAKNRSLQREIDIAEIRLKSYLQQFNPHDIMNTINGIGACILKKPADESYELLAQFARDLRRSLQYTGKLDSYFYDEAEKVAAMVTKEIQMRELRIDFVYPKPDDNDNDILIPRMLLYSVAAAHLNHLAQFGKIPLFLHIQKKTDNTKLFIEIRSGANKLLSFDAPPSPVSLGGKLIPLYLNLFEGQKTALQFTEKLSQRKEGGIENISSISWDASFSNLLISEAY